VQPCMSLKEGREETSACVCACACAYVYVCVCVCARAHAFKDIETPVLCIFCHACRSAGCFAHTDEK